MPPTAPIAAPLEHAAAAPPTVLLGSCYASFAYDVARNIDLNAAGRRIAGAVQRDRLKHVRRAPSSFQFVPLPLRVAQTSTPVEVAGFVSAPTVEMVLYDFGAVAVTFQFAVRGSLESLVSLSAALYDNAALLTDSRRRVEELLSTLGDAASRPGLSDLVEDYVIFCLDRLSPHDLPALSGAQRPLLARILRAESGVLAAQEVEEALACRFAYSDDDFAAIDWHAAVLVGPDDDVRSVLDFTNVELLEMRFLDAELDRALEESYRILTHTGRSMGFSLRAFDRDLRRIARLQAEGAMLFEGVDNALKLVGDQYLARVYRGASQRLHLPEWDTAILRKLAILESIYAKLSDEISRRRMEVLEWIIILLFVVSIVIPFLTGIGGH